MTRPVRLLPEARAEFHEAGDWYEQRREGLGEAFLEDVENNLGRISTDPQRHPLVYRDIRRVVVARFPYVILYRETGDEILVISVFHTSQDATLWKSRV